MQYFREKGNARGNVSWNMKEHCGASSRLTLNIENGTGK
jgi:hypothetical protein